MPMVDSKCSSLLIYWQHWIQLIAPTSWKHLFLLAAMTPHCPSFLPAFLPTATMPSPLCSFFLISQPHNMKELQGFDLGPFLFSTFTLMESSSGLTAFSTTVCWWHWKASIAQISSLNSRPVYPTAHWTSPFETSRASQSVKFKWSSWSSTSNLLNPLSFTSRFLVCHLPWLLSFSHTASTPMQSVSKSCWLCIQNISKYNHLLPLVLLSSWSKPP